MIEAHGLTRRFGNFTAVDSISLRVPAGAILALLGPNGAGKTTTVRMLAGLLAPTEGEATIAGFDVRRNPAAVRASVGLVTDAPGLYEQMNVVAYLHFFAAIYGMRAPERTRRIDALLDLFDLGEHRKERMSGFSKGLKQKVALARALLHEPTTLFLDEPTSGLDPLASRAVREMIVGLKQSSRSIILCTHDLDEAERLADEVAILRHGRIVLSDTPQALRAYASPDSITRIEFAESWSSGASLSGASLSGASLSGASLSGASLSGASLSGASLKRAVEEMVPASAGEMLVLDATDTSLCYRTSQPRSVNPVVIQRLVESGARIVSVTSETRTLEDVYADIMTAPDSLGALPVPVEVSTTMPQSTRG